MKVLHLNTVSAGGSAKGSLRMHKGLLKFGIDSHMITLEDFDIKEPNHIKYKQHFKSLSDRLKFKIKLTQTKKRSICFFVTDRIYTVREKLRLLDAYVIWFSRLSYIFIQEI